MEGEKKYLFHWIWDMKEMSFLSVLVKYCNCVSISIFSNRIGKKKCCNCHKIVPREYFISGVVWGRNHWNGRGSETDHCLPLFCLFLPKSRTFAFRQDDELCLQIISNFFSWSFWLSNYNFFFFWDARFNHFDLCVYCYINIVSDKLILAQVLFLFPICFSQPSLWKS